MIKKPIYTFNNTTSLGVFEVPLNSIVHIEDLSGKTKLVEKISNGTMNASSTIQDFLDDSALYLDIGAEEIIEFVGANTTLESGVLYVCATTGADLAEGTTAYTLTLPASPEDGDIIRIGDKDSNAQSRPALVERNGKTIDGLAENLTLDVDYFDIKLIYNTTDSDWTLTGK